MADLKLAGILNLQGKLELAGDGGTVKASGGDVLVVGATGTGPVPVLIGAPPKPTDDGTKVEVKASFNQTVTARGKVIVAQGICVQGASGTWPGMVQASIGNPGVKANNIPMNVKNDIATILPTGAPATFDQATGQP